MTNNYAYVNLNDLFFFVLLITVSDPDGFARSETLSKCDMLWDFVLT